MKYFQLKFFPICGIPSTQTSWVGVGEGRGRKEPGMTVHTVMRSTILSQCSGTET